MIETKKVPVDGMHCGSCAISIEMIFKNQEGVKSVSVSFDNKEAVIEYDPEKINLSTLSESISPLGYTLRLSD
ncbi:MAG: heavy-metal-associated domain-containing protein [Caldiserica bacterium]|nr:heavy-metal-associated domain-containing protein [Caldisericota bacterium]